MDRGSTYCTNNEINEIIECSGVILSQHSETLKKLIHEDEEVFLLGFESVYDILTILHGGYVILFDFVIL